jgi:hypothetical protein
MVAATRVGRTSRGFQRQLGGVVESDIRYYTRRAAAEMLAARRAVTPAARERRIMLAESYQEKLRALGV